MLTGCERSVLNDTRRHSARMTSTPKLLPDLTADDLKDLGITSIGHRRQLLEAIAALRPEGTPADDPVRCHPPADQPDREPRLV